MPRAALAEYPAAVVRLACTKCARQGQYGRDRLLERHGSMALPDILRRIASDCPKQEGLGNDRCGAYYADLARLA